MINGEMRTGITTTRRLDLQYRSRRCLVRILFMLWIFFYNFR